jgi:hypothetical protein
MISLANDEIIFLLNHGSLFIYLFTYLQFLVIMIVSNLAPPNNKKY